LSERLRFLPKATRSRASTWSFVSAASAAELFYHRRVTICPDPIRARLFLGRMRWLCVVGPLASGIRCHQLTLKAACTSNGGRPHDRQFHATRCPRRRARAGGGKPRLRRASKTSW
jgi:hypothetical protein